MKQVTDTRPYITFVQKKVQVISDLADIAWTHQKVLLDYLLFNILPR